MIMDGSAVSLHGRSRRRAAHRGHAIGVRELHLQLVLLPLATDNLQGNGRLCSEVCDQFDLFLRKCSTRSLAKANDPISSCFLSMARRGASEGRPAE